MNEVWYDAKSCFGEIHEVSVERYTDSFVWIAGRRQKRQSEYQHYFENREMAKSYLLSVAHRNVARAQAQLGNAKVTLAKVEKL